MELKTQKELEELCNRLDAETTRFGLELTPFQIGWYNDALRDDVFAFRDVSPDTLAFVVVSSPKMFEKAFLPFVLMSRSQEDAVDGSGERRDPLDECMTHHFQRIRNLFLREQVDVEPMHDFQVASAVSKRPKVLVQTAAHVAGVARLYQPQDLDGEGVEMLKAVMDDAKKKVFPVSLHPKYGGWFGLRGVLLFRNVTCRRDLLVQKSPRPVCRNQAEIVRLLYLFNCHWRDCRYRDVGIDNAERYSRLQQEYFYLPPAERTVLLTRLRLKLEQQQEQLSDNCDHAIEVCFS